MGLDGLQEGPVGVVGRPNNYLRNILLTHAHILIPPVLSVPSVAGKEERRGARRDEVGKEAQERVASAGRRTERGVNGGAFDGEAVQSDMEGTRNISKESTPGRK